MLLELTDEEAHEVASALWKSRKGMSNRITKLTAKYGDEAHGIQQFHARIARVDKLIAQFEASGHFERHMHQPDRD